MITVKCPICKKAVEWSETSKYRPFCSEFCKNKDLGAWASESYHIPTDGIGDNSLTSDENEK